MTQETPTKARRKLTLEELEAMKNEAASDLDLPKTTEEFLETATDLLTGSRGSTPARRSRVASAKREAEKTEIGPEVEMPKPVRKARATKPVETPAPAKAPRKAPVKKATPVGISLVTEKGEVLKEGLSNRKQARLFARKLSKDQTVILRDGEKETTYKNGGQA